MVCVDRVIVTNSPPLCFDPVNNGGTVSSRDSHHQRPSSNPDGDESATPTGLAGSVVSFENNNNKNKNKAKEIVECRVCQEEDDVLSMEAPCACNGTLKVFPFLGFSHLTFFLFVEIIIIYIFFNSFGCCGMIFFCALQWHPRGWFLPSWYFS